MDKDEIASILYIFDEERNKGLKHITKYFRDILVGQKNLSEPEQLEIMQEIELLVEELGSPKAINNFCGIQILLDIAGFNQFNKVRKIALSVVGSIGQNNSSIQKPAIEAGALTMVNIILFLLY